MAYIDYATETTTDLKMQDLIDTKIEILYDMGILKKRYKNKHTVIPDAREDDLRDLLGKCKSRHELDTLLHDVVRGDMALKTLLAQGIKYLIGGN